MLAHQIEANEARYPKDPMVDEVVLTTGESLKVTNGAFSPEVADGFQPTMLAGLADEKIAALHMRNAVDLKWCDRVSDRFAQHPETKKEGVSPPIYSLGSHLYSAAEGETFSGYFKNIEQRNLAISSVLPEGHDPIVSFLKEACKVNNAEFEYLSFNDESVRHGSLRLWGGGSRPAEDGRCYFAVPHEDYEETNADHALLEQIHDSDNVYSIILCIDAVDDKEPETIVWDKHLTLEEIRDPNNKHPWASYGYSESILEGVESMLFRLKKGDAAIIPSHNVHAVVGFPGFRRCTYMAFFHLIKTESGGFSKMIFRT